MKDIRTWSPTLVSVPGAGGGYRSIACRACETPFCRTDAVWKEHAVLDEKPLTQTGAAFAGAGREVLLRRFFCPSCGTTLDTEVALPGESFLIDRIVE